MFRFNWLKVSKHISTSGYLRNFYNTANKSLGSEFCYALIKKLYWSKCQNYIKAYSWLLSSSCALWLWYCTAWNWTKIGSLTFCKGSGSFTPGTRNPRPRHRTSKLQGLVPGKKNPWFHGLDPLSTTSRSPLQVIQDQILWRSCYCLRRAATTQHAMKKIMKITARLSLAFIFGKFWGPQVLGLCFGVVTFWGHRVSGSSSFWVVEFWALWHWGFDRSKKMVDLNHVWGPFP